MRLSILAAAFAALAATSASAASLATFDLTFERTINVGAGATVTSDRGTVMTIDAFDRGGVRTLYTRDVDASGPTSANLPPTGQIRGFFGCGNRGCDLARFGFGRQVFLRSIDFLVRAADGSATANVALDLANTPYFLRTGVDGTVTPTIFTQTFGPSALVTDLSITGGSDLFSLKSITVLDPTLAPIPLPAAAWLLLGGLGALGAVARKRAA